MPPQVEKEFCVCGHNRICHHDDLSCQECFETGKICERYDPGDESGRLQSLPKDILTTNREDLMRSVGHKDDFEKTNYFALPWDALNEVAEVMTFGAQKYKVHNFRLPGMKSSRLFSASLRHMYAWVRGEEKDLESGKSHLAHAACCILMLRDKEIIGTDEDDRWKGVEDYAGRFDSTDS